MNTTTHEESEANSRQVGGFIRKAQMAFEDGNTPDNAELIVHNMTIAYRLGGEHIALGGTGALNADVWSLTLALYEGLRKDPAKAYEIFDTIANAIVD